MNPEAFTISSFCEAHELSRAFLYNLIKTGRGPRVVKLGRKRLITREDAEKWRRQIEASPAAR